MQLAFQYGTATVQFQVIFRKRKTMTIMVEAPDKVTAIVPLNTRPAIILEKVQARAAWIIKKLEYFKNAQPYTPRKYVDGETFPYLGEDYQLQVEENTASSRYKWMLLSDRLGMYFPIKEAESIEEALVAWYRRQAWEKITARVKYFQNRLLIGPNRIVIKDQKTRWGSCSSKGNLNFNWRIIMAPPVIIDYIVVHEMCHLVHLNHSQEFWNLVGEILPDYKDRRKWLKINGTQLSL